MAWKTDRFRGVTLALLMGVSMVPGGAASAERATQRCVDASRADAVVTLAGRLALQSFAGPPNYESRALGDAEERAFILELPRRICFDDGEFADGSERFDRVHVVAADKHLAEALRAAIGHEVTIVGKAMGAHSGHHRAPMVLFATSREMR